MELVLSQGVFGRPFVLPPGVPPERVEALRKAFMAAMADPALLSEARRRTSISMRSRARICRR